MAGAARPTTRAHARTPLGQAAAPEAHQAALCSACNMIKMTFSKLLNDDHRPRRGSRASAERVDAAVLWLAGRVLVQVRPLDAPAAARSAHNGLLGSKETVVIAIGTAMQNGAEAGFLLPASMRGCCFAIFACGPAQWSCPLLSTISRLSCACTGRVCTRSKWSSRGVRTCAREGCWQSSARRCGDLSLEGMLQVVRADVREAFAVSAACF